MREIAVINPSAGGGTAESTAQNIGKSVAISENKLQSTYARTYYTKKEGDCRRIVAECLREDPSTHFDIYGGDGSISDAVCGILDAGAGETATFTICPAGSGNDTIKSLPTEPKGKIIPLDAIRVNDRHAINMLNIGFDCNVVVSSEKFKKMRFSGRTFAYLMGIVTEFFKPFGEDFHIVAECIDGTTFDFEGSCLLCAICNGEWCGGGFHNSPASDMSDGVLEMLLVKKTSRLNFIKLIGKYKDGTLLDPKTDLPPKGYEDIVIYRRIKSITVSGTTQICIDGEIAKTDCAKVEVVPQAVGYRI